MPECMIENDPSLEGKVIFVSRALYGLAVSPKAFNWHLDAKLRQMGYTPSGADPCLYMKGQGADAQFIICYVDDLCHVGNAAGKLEFRKLINIDTNPDGFKVRDYGEPTSFLGIEISRNRAARTITLSQGKYIRDICERFNITTDKAPQTPMPHKLDLGALPDEHKLTDMTEFRSKVGALMYAAHCVRSDACGPVQQFSRYLHAATPTMLTHLNSTLKYFLATAGIGLTYDGKKPGPVYGYSDADWAGDATTRRSTSGYVFMRNNAAVTWSSSLQPSVAHSTSDAEWRALSDCGREALWLRTLEKDLTSVESLAPTQLCDDNKGALKWATDPANHKKSKHIDISYNSIREQVVEFKNLIVKYVPTVGMLADPFTKNLLPGAFKDLFGKIFGLNKPLSPASPAHPSRGG